MPVTISTAVVRRRVRLDLRRHRENAGLNQREAAEQSGLGAGHLAHFESGRNVPSDEAARKLFTTYGVRDELDEFLALLVEARRRTPSAAAASDPEQFNLYAGLEQGASRIESYEALVLHGLVQTEQYAEALMRGHGQGLSEAEVRRRLRLRLRRQDVLTGDSPTRLWLLIKQHILAEPVGGPDVLRGQLEHLLKLSELPNVDIQMIRRDTVAYPALHTPFTIMQFDLPSDPGLVYIETRAKGLFFEETAEIQDYAQVMSHLRVLAAPQEESAAIIDAMRKEIA